MTQYYLRMPALLHLSEVQKLLVNVTPIFPIDSSGSWCYRKEVLSPPSWVWRIVENQRENGTGKLTRYLTFWIGNCNSGWGILQWWSGRQDRENLVSWLYSQVIYFLLFYFSWDLYPHKEKKSLKYRPLK